MIIEKQTKIGNAKIELPIEYGDIIINGNTEYSINRIVVVSDSIFLVNTYSGLWVNVEEVELIREKNNRKYFKITPKED